MWGFSFNWFLIIFLLQVMSIEIAMAKIGEVQVKTYSPALLVLYIFFANMARYWISNRFR